MHFIFALIAKEISIELDLFSIFFFVEVVSDGKEYEFLREE